MHGAFVTMFDRDHGQTRWHITAEEVAMCNCGWGCSCRGTEAAPQDGCEALVAARVRQGRYADVVLDGLVFVGAWWWPGAIHEGRGIIQPAIDVRADEAQRAALLDIITGRAGGMPFEIFAATVSSSLPAIVAAIRFEADPLTHRLSLDIPGLGTFQATQAPDDARTRGLGVPLGGGFEYLVAELGSTVRLSSQLREREVRHRNTFAHFASVQWSNLTA